MKNQNSEQAQFKQALVDDTGPELDFDKMEAALMSRVSQDTSRRKLRSRVSVGIGVLAMAAAAALVITRTPTATPGDEAAHNNAAITADPGAGALESGSDVSVVAASGDKHVLALGESVKRGDQVEASRALFRAAGRVVFAVSSDGSGAASKASVSVSETDRPIVLSLARGTVEAQVDKVPSGEAFAVDVTDSANTVRIAVHGTHLRVARTNKHVTLDLTEGIVNVGRPPKSGSTYGKLVTAPAHVEFDVDALESTLTMTKDTDKVRVAEDLSPQTAVVVAQQQPAPLPQSAPIQPSQKAPVAPTVQVAAPSQVVAKDPGVVPAPAEPRVDARTAINEAISTCAMDKLRNSPQQGSNAVNVSVVSTLSLRVGEDGYVQAARFEPPLDPEVQKCAAATIYKVHFDDSSSAANRSVMLPISLRAQVQ